MSILDFFTSSTCVTIHSQTTQLILTCPLNRNHGRLWMLVRLRKRCRVSPQPLWRLRWRQRHPLHQRHQGEMEADFGSEPEEVSLKGPLVKEAASLPDSTKPLPEATKSSEALPASSTRAPKGKPDQGTSCCKGSASRC